MRMHSVAHLPVPSLSQCVCVQVLEALIIFRCYLHIISIAAALQNNYDSPRDHYH